jgi:hypothetical protein
VIRSHFAVIHLLQLAWWHWARENLQRVDPMHPDLPGIVLRIHALENGRA